MSTGAKRENQSRVDQSGGGQSQGATGPSSRLYQPPKFMGRSGMSDNQSTSRGKGRT